MQSVRSRIWTRVAVFISYDDNDYTTGISDIDWEQYWTSPATYHPSQKLSKLDGPDMRDTAGEVGMSS